MEELLKIAKENYPVDTVFKSAYNPNRKGKVTHLNFFVENKNIFTDQLYDDLAEEGIGEAIYYEGVWAEIISKPEVKEADIIENSSVEWGGKADDFIQELKKEVKFKDLVLKDNINPSHYSSGKIECIDAIESALSPEEFRGFLRGNVLKYNWRCMQKNGDEDLKKSQWYLDRLIKTLENATTRSN